MFDSYSGKTVLMTGHTGFKGSWLAAWLSTLGARVVGLSDALPSQPCNFEASALAPLVTDLRADVRDLAAMRRIVEQTRPDFVFHLAAQALVRRSYASPTETFAVNGMGTAHVLEALRLAGRPVVAVMITSDKAYDNVECVWGYRETDRLGGKDPYSGSKGVAELVIRSYVASFMSQPDGPIRLGITRAGNVIGGGDWASDRIVPDCMRAWSEGRAVDIRSPHATRPWQHVLEPLSGYLALGQALATRSDLHGQAYNFGPATSQDHTVGELLHAMASHWSGAQWRDVSSQSHLHEAGLLKLNCDKAYHDLRWLPTLNFAETASMTVNWYRTFYESRPASMLDFTLDQIRAYVELAQARELAWSRP